MTERERLEALVLEMRADAAHCLALSPGGCQSEYQWHAERYSRWADELSALRASQAQLEDSAFKAGFQAGLYAVDKFGNQHTDLDEALTDWRAEREMP